jgi:hypothetical protein
MRATPPFLNDAEDFCREVGLGHIFVGILDIQVSEHIAAAPVDGSIVAHAFPPFCSASKCSVALLSFPVAS